MMETKMKHTETRSGSALVVVLGMLAVIMLMAVAFSVYMRTERAGTTNLRHASTAPWRRRRARPGGAFRCQMGISQPLPPRGVCMSPRATPAPIRPCPHCR